MLYSLLCRCTSFFDTKGINTIYLYDLKSHFIFMNYIDNKIHVENKLASIDLLLLTLTSIDDK